MSYWRDKISFRTDGGLLFYILKYSRFSHDVTKIQTKNYHLNTFI